MLRNELFGFVGDDIGNIFVFPEGGFSSCHPSDTWDTVNNGVIVSLAGFKSNQFRIFFTCGPIPYFMLIIYRYWIVRIEPHYASVLYKYTGDTVYRGRNHEFVVETDILCIGRNLFVEVGTSFRP